ncbi:hypothetical protein OROMI_014449 [Orobanche minor]
MINIDGSWFSDGNDGGIGCIARDHNGCWEWGFSMKAPLGSVDGVELGSALLALQQAWTRRIPKVILETDSENVFSWLMGFKKPPLHLVPNVEECMKLLRMPWTITLKKISRNANGCADALAKLRLHAWNEVVILDTPPPNVCSLLSVDSV